VYILGFPGSSEGKESIPWKREWQATPVCLPGESPEREEPGKLQFMGTKNNNYYNNTNNKDNNNSSYYYDHHENHSECAFCSGKVVTEIKKKSKEMTSGTTLSNDFPQRKFPHPPNQAAVQVSLGPNVILKGPPPGSHFPEGDHKIQYTVYDRAENKGTCKFRVKVRVRRCGKLHAPENGYMKCSSDGDNYGAVCEFSCVGGYELQGSSARVCQSNLAWSGAEPTCTAMNVNVGVRTAAALLDQFYEKRRLFIVSTPTARNLLYRLQLGLLQFLIHFLGTSGTGTSELPPFISGICLGGRPSICCLPRRLTQELRRVQGPSGPTCHLRELPQLPQSSSEGGEHLSEKQFSEPWSMD
ncbi:hypothetical protein FD755_025416, partial [Muntiacus reevesi]